MSRGLPIDETYARVLVHKNIISCIYLRTFTFPVIDKSGWEQMSDRRDTRMSFSISRCVQSTEKDEGTISVIDFRGREP